MSDSLLKYIFKYMEEPDKNNLNNYLSDILTREYTDFSELDIMNITPELNEEDRSILQDYISYDFSNINATLRHTWNYEANGHISNKDRYEEKGRNLVELINNNPKSIGNKRVYRGIDLNYFKQFGINSLSELPNLKGQYILDEGVVSTSIREEDCFFKRNLGPNTNYNIKMIYNLPEEFNDGIFIGDKDLKLYEKSESEYLINTANLGYVSDVELQDDDTAIVKVVMIPKKIYDEYYRHLEEERKIK